MHPSEMKHPMTAVNHCTVFGTTHEPGKVFDAMTEEAAQRLHERGAAAHYTEETDSGTEDTQTDETSEVAASSDTITPTRRTRRGFGRNANKD